MIDSKIIRFVLHQIFTLVILALILGLSTLIPHYERQFFERDPSMSYYDSGDQVPVSMMYAITLSISYGTIVVGSFVIESFTNRQIVNITHFQKMVLLLCALTFALLTTGCTTEILKNVVGRPRPAFFYLCNYKGYADAVNSRNYTQYDALTVANRLGNFDECYDNTNFLDSISSFPSGHTSVSFCAMLFTETNVVR